MSSNLGSLVLLPEAKISEYARWWPLSDTDPALEGLTDNLAERSLFAEEVPTPEPYSTLLNRSVAAPLRSLCRSTLQ